MGQNLHNQGIKDTLQTTVWGPETSVLSGTIGPWNSDTALVNKSSPIKITGNFSFVKVAGSGGSSTTGFAIALDGSGNAWSWGNNAQGQLGDNSRTSRSSPVLVVGSHSFTDVACGAYYALYLKGSTGEVWGVGYNDTGQLGTINTTSRSSPVLVVGGHSFIKVAAGGTTSAALKANGEIWGWGNNGFGGLGDGTRTNRSSPVLMVGSHSFASVSVCGDNVAGLKADTGGMWITGNNVSGQLGQGNTTSRSSPVLVMGAHSFIKLIYGRGSSNCACALKDNGQIWAWGTNAQGQLGDGTVTDRSSPVLVVGNHSFIDLHGQIAALKSDGSRWGAGFGSSGQLGQDTSAVDRSSPVLVVGNHSFIQTFSANGCSGGLKSNGEVWMWGDDTSGSLGNYSYYGIPAPTADMAGNHSFIELTAGDLHSVGLKADGTAWSWGYNLYGQLGDNTVVSKSSPVLVVGSHSFTQISGGTNCTLFRKEDTGIVWGVGLNSSGQLGCNYGITAASSPVLVIGAHSFIAVAAGDAFQGGLKADGSVWTWGTNAAGVLGDNSTTSSSSPIAVIGSHSFIAITRGNRFTVGLKSDGTAWTWGYNQYGQLGSGGTTSYSSPILVVGSHSFIKVAAGDQHAAGLKADGSCWAWGYNTAGQLGDNSRTNRSSPVLVVGSHSFIEVKASSSYTMCLKADGSAWTWGTNAAGNFGDNSRISRSSPILVLGAHSFISICCGTAHITALKANGQIWSWGLNTAGQLGTGNTTSYSSPVLVIGNHSFITLAERTATSSFAIKDDGSCWAWGDNSNTCLGDTTTTNRSSPVLVMGNGVWKNVAGTTSHTIFLSKRDGYAYTSGLNGAGQLGVGNVEIRTSYSSPVLVVGNHSFIQMDLGVTHSIAVKSTGDAWSWGINAYGELAPPRSDTVTCSSPILVIGNHSFIKMSTGKFLMSALKADGSVWTWGYNNSGECGTYLTGTNLNYSSPVMVVGNHSFVEISVGGNVTGPLQFMLARKDDGSCFAWGNNNSGQLGNNTMVSCSMPVMVVGNHSFTQIGCGTLSGYGLKSDGSIWSWGLNSTGQLGTDNVTSYSSPVLVVGSHSFIKIAPDHQYDGTISFVAALKDDGSVWTWGNNTYGQLGTGDTTSRSSPVLVIGNHSFIDIVSNKGAVLARKDSGAIWSWGWNDAGQLGTGNTTSYSSPVLVIGNHSFIKMATGLDVVHCLKENGEAWGWGAATQGQIGDNVGGMFRSSPVLVAGNHSFIEIVSGTVSGGLKANGEAWVWGVGTNGVTGQGAIVYAVSTSSPIQVIGSHSFTLVKGGGNTSFGLKSNDGSIWSWGLNSAGQLGQWTLPTIGVSFPVAIVGNFSFTDLAVGLTHAVALKSNGEVWSWGAATAGLGNNTLTTASSPVLVVGGHSFIKISAGNDFSLALKANGESWAWGTSNSGALGEGVVGTSRSSPVLVVGNHSFVSITCASSSSYGLKSNGEIWAWGNNISGQLGNGSSTGTSSPVLVVGNHSFTTISGGPSAMYGLKANTGELWAWGDNSYGQLGTNNMTSYSSPVLVVGNHSFISFKAHPQGKWCVALKSDGSAWTWGDDSQGSLGQGISQTSRSSPVLVVGSHSFVKVGAGGWQGSGIKSDGSCWTWGLNGGGQLGNGLGNQSLSSPVLVVGGHSFITASGSNTNTMVGLAESGTVYAWGNAVALSALSPTIGTSTTSVSSPVMVVGSHSFVSMAVGVNHTLGLKSNGTVWAWGTNSSGQLGVGHIGLLTSPTQVVGNHSFIAVSAGNTASSALKRNGEMWAWGTTVATDSAYEGQGAGTQTVSRSSPVLVVGGYKFRSLADTTLYSLSARIWLHKMAGVANADIAKILGVSIDDVNKVAGVQ